MTAELIATIVGMMVSVGLEVIPGLKEKWTDWRWKRLTLLGGFVLLPAAAWALSCYGGIQFVPMSVNCDVQGGLQAAGIGFLSFVGNQAAFGVGVRKLDNAVGRAGL